MQAKLTLVVKSEFRQLIPRLEKISVSERHGSPNQTLSISMGVNATKKPDTLVEVPKDEMHRLREMIDAFPRNAIERVVLYFSDDNEGTSSGFLFSPDFLRDIAEAGMELSTEIYCL